MGWRMLHVVPRVLVAVPLLLSTFALVHSPYDAPTRKVDQPREGGRPILWLLYHVACRKRPACDPLVDSSPSRGGWSLHPPCIEYGHAGDSDASAPAEKVREMLVHRSAKWPIAGGSCTTGDSARGSQREGRPYGQLSLVARSRVAALAFCAVEPLVGASPAALASSDGGCAASSPRAAGKVASTSAAC